MLGRTRVGGLGTSALLDCGHCLDKWLLQTPILSHQPSVIMLAPYAQLPLAKQISGTWPCGLTRPLLMPTN